LIFIDFIEKLFVFNRETNFLEALMGPTVCELEGPIPILNNLKRLIYINH